jgi:capsular polysaccharide biosynthesis protein
MLSSKIKNMELINFIQLIKRKKQTIFSVTLLFFLISALLTFVQPFKYASEARLLVVQNAPAGVDPYQINKANEYVADVLARVIPTNSFFNEVIKTDFNINKTYFPTDPLKQLKKWKKTVKAYSSNTGGIISISVLHPDKYQSNQIIEAVNSIIKSNHAFYHGSGEQVSVRVIDEPFTSIFPVSPNIPFNLIAGVLFGLIFALSYIFLFPEEAYNLKFWPKRKAKKVNFQVDKNQFKKALIKNNNQNLEKLYNEASVGEMQEEQVRDRVKSQAQIQAQNQTQTQNQTQLNNQIQARVLEEDFVIQGNMRNLGV